MTRLQRGFRAAVAVNRGRREPDELDELVWQVADAEGAVVSSSQPLAGPLPRDDADEVSLPGGDHGYVVVTKDARSGAAR